MSRAVGGGVVEAAAVEEGGEVGEVAGVGEQGVARGVALGLDRLEIAGEPGCAAAGRRSPGVPASRVWSGDGAGGLGLAGEAEREERGAQRRRVDGAAARDEVERGEDGVALAAGGDGLGEGALAVVGRLVGGRGRRRRRRGGGRRGRRRHGAGAGEGEEGGGRAGRASGRRRGRRRRRSPARRRSSKSEARAGRAAAAAGSRAARAGRRPRRGRRGGRGRRARRRRRGGRWRDRPPAGPARAASSAWTAAARSQMPPEAAGTPER